jgi:hypothetical protein
MIQKSHDRKLWLMLELKHLEGVRTAEKHESGTPPSGNLLQMPQLPGNDSRQSIPNKSEQQTPERKRSSRSQRKIVASRENRDETICLEYIQNCAEAATQGRRNNRIYVECSIGVVRSYCHHAKTDRNHEIMGQYEIVEQHEMVGRHQSIGKQEVEQHKTESTPYLSELTYRLVLWGI